MNILDGLLGEHAAVLTVFEHMEQNAPRMDLDRLHEAGLLLERLLRTHSISEDECLFDCIGTVAGGLGETLEAMRGEHREMAHELDALRASSNEAAARGCLMRIMQFTREHFEVEERVLFHLASAKLAEPRLAELGAAWKRRRMPESDVA